GLLEHYCVGNLRVSDQGLNFKTSKSNDMRMDEFSAAYDQIKEIKANKTVTGGYPAFHVKLVDGQNFNFVAVDESDNAIGNSLPLYYIGIHSGKVPVIQPTERFFDFQ